MANFGFGPRGANAVTTRPTGSTADPYAKQTWFKDASAAGKKDGTIIDADWLNQFIAERILLADASGVALSTNLPNDAFLLNAIVALIGSRIASAALTGQQISDMLDTVHGTPWRDTLAGADIVTAIDGALGSEWRNVTTTTVQSQIDTAITNLKNGVSTALDTLDEIADALNNDPNIAATLTTLISNETARATAAEGTLTTDLATEVADRTAADATLAANLSAEIARALAAEALLVPIASIIDDLVTGGSAVPLSAQQGVVLKGLIDGLMTSLATEATTRATDDATEVTNRTNADAVLQALITALTSLSGVAASGTDLGTFTGATITDNVSIKTALQELETALELRAVATALGTMALQNAIAVAITGGAIDGTAIGATTPSTVRGTTLESTGSATVGDDLAVADDVSVGGDTAVAGRLAVAINAFVVDQLTKRIGVNTASPACTADFDGATDAIALPRGTTAQRPAAASGWLRMNSDTGRLEWFDGAAWQSIPVSALAVGSII